MSDALQVLTEFGVPHEVQVVAAHRTPDEVIRYGREARGPGIPIIIAGATHLPGMLASVPPLPVISVPVQLAALDCLDSTLSIVQVPAGIRVSTVSINGARNASPLAVRILVAGDPAVAELVERHARDLERQVEETNPRPKESL